jgi:hypothetical protein
MGKLAALLFASVTGTSVPPDQPLPPLPRPKPAPTTTRTIEITCIDDWPIEPPMLVCENPWPPLPFGLSFLPPCPDWIDKIVAEADAL